MVAQLIGHSQEDAHCQTDQQADGAVGFGAEGSGAVPDSVFDVGQQEVAGGNQQDCRFSQGVLSVFPEDLLCQNDNQQSGQGDV